MIIYKQTPVTLSKTENFRFNKRMERLKQPTVSIPEKKGQRKASPRKGAIKGYQRKGTGKELFCKHLFDLSFAEVSERNRKLRNSNKSPGKKPKLSDTDHQHILSLLEKQPDVTCLEIIETLNLPVSIDTVRRFLQKAGYRRKKKSLNASEQERPRCGAEEKRLERPYIWVQCK